MTPEVSEPEVEWRAALGGQIEEASHGVLDLGVRRGPLSAQLFTDTLDLRARLAGDHGLVDAGLRAAAFAAGLWIDPWAAGAPDATRAHRTAYMGPDLRLERWLPYGTYAAVEASAHWCVFTPLPDAQIEVPDQGVLRLDAILGGYWADGAWQARALVGTDQTTEGISAHHIGLTLLARPPGGLAPVGEWRFLLAENQDDVVATRVGGMTPYAVPLAGAGWAEFWVEDLVAARAGLVFRAGMLQLSGIADAAAWSYPRYALRAETAGRLDAAAGASLSARLQRSGIFGELSVGHATVERPDDVMPISIWLLAGTDWRPLHEGGP